MEQPLRIFIDGNGILVLSVETARGEYVSVDYSDDKFYATHQSTAPEDWCSSNKPHTELSEDQVKSVLASIKEVLSEM